MKKFSNQLFQTAVSILLCLISLPLWANQLQPENIPQPLQPWVKWVLHDHPDRDCPFYYNQATSICRWPSRLELKVNASQAEFQQEWQVYSEGWITLPGDAQSWPQGVQVNGAPVLVADQKSLPRVFLPIGPVTLKGQFDWKQRPEFLQVPAETGIIALTIDNTPMTIPTLDEQGRLWLRQGGMQTGSETAEENRLDMRVFRHLIDDIPVQLITRIELDVAGRHREVVLGPTMLDKQVAMSLDSPLPARLEPDGRLRVQVRPGTYVLTLRSRQTGVTNRFSLAPTEEGQWVKEEVWTFAARNELRFVEVTGVTAIDPQQTALPEEWRKFPAYQVRPGETVELAEKRRGDPDPAPDQLKLERQFWLDFDGKGYSIQDRIGGTMTRGWRLEMTKPAVLGRVNVNDQDQFITHLPKSDQTGIEVRRGQIKLVADSRLEEAVNKLPAVGWAHDFQQVSAVLHLPPGWRLLNAMGVDNVPKTWLKQWTLLDLFIVLIMATAVGKLWRWWWGVLALVTLVLIHHEAHAPYWVWLHLIAALALLRVLPELGWFSRFVRIYRNVSIIALLIIALPFMMQQARQSLFPQLERPWAKFDTSQDYRANVGGTMQTTGEMEEMNQEIRPKGGELPATIMQQDQSAAPPPPAAPADSELAEEEYAPQSFRYQRPIYAKKAKAGKVASSKLVQIDPNAQVQTGPGLPQWQWENIQMRWNGPVEATQQVQLWLLPPKVNSLLGFVRIILLAMLTMFLLWVSWSKEARKWFKPTVSSPPINLAATTALVLFGLLCYLPLATYAEEITAPNLPPQQQVNAPNQNQEDAQQQTNQPSVKDLESLKNLQGLTEKVLKDLQGLFPPQNLLEELKNRLLAPPDCLQAACASSPRLRLDLDATQLTIRMEIHSYADIAVPLPGVAKQWLAQQIVLDDKPAQAFLRQPDGQLWLNVHKGIHQVLLAGPLPTRNTVQLPLPLKPHFVEINAKGWQVEGLHENGLADDQLQFTREQTESRLATLEMGSLPPFVQIERTLLLGLDWQIATRVTRLTPTGAAIVLEIPLLKGESVTTENIRVQNEKVLLNLSPNDTEINWLSVFSKQDTLQLTAPNNTFSSEVWRLDASAIWHVDLEGIPVVHHQDNEGRWLPEWRPWPGESVTLHFSRPEGVTGQVLTIDRSQLIVVPGQRTTDNTLSVTLRSSRGGQHTITLPDQAQLQSVKINGKSQPIRQEGRKVTLPITPGQQQIELVFRQAIGMNNYFQTPSLDLGSHSVNTNIQLKMPVDRWILFVDDAPIGPAVMIWGLLIVIFLTSLGLGRVSLTPLKFHHWFLLGLVISQVHIASTLLIVAWFMALGSRAQQPADLPPFKFDIIQLGLGILTIASLLTLVAAIQKGLLGLPQMHIEGNGSSAYLLRWYEDRTTGILPSVWVYSWSLWAYRIAMLLWALWLSFALMRWLKWGWECFSANGWWKPLRRKGAVQT
jgi:hypothetical protein